MSMELTDDRRDGRTGWVAAVGVKWVTLLRYLSSGIMGNVASPKKNTHDVRKEGGSAYMANPNPKTEAKGMRGSGEEVNNKSESNRAIRS